MMWKERGRGEYRTKEQGISIFEGFGGRDFWEVLTWDENLQSIFHDQCPNKREVRAAHRHTRYYLFNYTNSA
jgi:hypothetical protein